MAWYDKIGDAIQSNILDPIKEEASRFETRARETLGYGTGRSQAKRNAEKAQRRQQQELQRQRKLDEQAKRRRKATLMSALQDGGAPDLFSILGTPQDQL